MEPIRFADILFTALTLLIIYLILFLVNKARREKNEPDDNASMSKTTDINASSNEAKEKFKEDPL
jgi:uncharacterized membrane protein